MQLENDSYLYLNVSPLAREILLVTIDVGGSFPTRMNHIRT